MGDPQRRRLMQPLRDFLRTEAGGGLAVVIAAVMALVWANSAWAETYEALWTSEVRFGFDSLTFGMDLRHWVNEGLMTLFFLIVGLEIKRELVEGELRDRSRRNLPIAAALGGMVLPALVYTLFNTGGPAAGGWGIPMATDIALAVGVLSLAGRSAGASLKLFLLALAIVDDVGAIAVIALFYSRDSNPMWLLVSAVVIAALVFVTRSGGQRLLWYLLLGGVLWLSFRAAGIHATLAGVVVGLLVPATPTNSMIERLEYRLHGWTSFVVVPLFALANAGIDLSGSLADALTSAVGLGVFLGLVVGKPLGVLGFSWLAVRMGWAALPDNVGWARLWAVAMLAGIGFTVSIFIAELAVADEALLTAKLAILSGSALAALAGLAVLKLLPRPTADA